MTDEELGELLRRLAALEKQAREPRAEVAPMSAALAPRSSLMPFSATGTYFIGPIARDLTLIQFVVVAYVDGANDGSNYWTVELQLHPGATVTGIVNTSTSNGSTFLVLEDTSFSPAAVDSATYQAFQIVCTKTGSPGDLYAAPEILYR